MISLVVIESLNWCNNANCINFKLDCTEKDLLASIRLKSKFYTGDKLLTLDNQKIRLMEIVKSEQHFFCNQSTLAKILYPLGLIKDVGTYSIDKHYIGNTILYSDYYDNFRTNSLKRKFEQDFICHISYICGSILIKIINSLSREEFVCRNDLINSNRIVEDNFVLDDCFFYKGDINRTMLFNHLCNINFACKLLNRFLSIQSSLLFRYKYLTYYHAICDLSELGYTRTVNHKYLKRNFRNVMAHYGLTNIMQKDSINYNLIFFGLLESVFATDYAHISEYIDEELLALKQLIENKLGL